MVHAPFSANHPADADLQAELDAIAGMSLDDLRVSFRRLTRRTAPPGLPRLLLQRIVAYHLQAAVLGDLDAETVRYLDRIARDRINRKATDIPDGNGPSGRALPDQAGIAPIPRRLRPGTQLVREHDGELHRVTVLEKGFSWNGRTYTSLSDIARKITGTSWNGPAFFGLRSKKGLPAITGGDLPGKPGGAP